MILLALSQQNLRTYCVRPLNYVPDTFYRPSESSTVHSRERLSRWKNGEMYSFIEWYTYHIDTVYTYDFWPITGDDSFHHLQWIFLHSKNLLREYGYFLGPFSEKCTVNLLKSVPSTQISCAPFVPSPSVKCHQWPVDKYFCIPTEQRCSRGNSNSSNEKNTKYIKIKIKSIHTKRNK